MNPHELTRKDSTARDYSLIDILGSIYICFEWLCQCICLVVAYMKYVIPPINMKCNLTSQTIKNVFFHNLKNWSLNL